ncbi:MAG: 1-deoxy-D-xylulose-5-phosphate reductoisomerase [Lentisphaeria bacterium]|nr:1-deoxy-D-xylulose-5-phosphate reductoisomerase [Lentisphaeria bacterium]
MKKVFILGSTGSIGTNTLRVLRAQPDDFQVIGLAAGRNGALLTEQCREFSPKYAYLQDTKQMDAIALPDGIAKIRSLSELCDIIYSEDFDILLCAITGTEGFLPVLKAIQSKKDIALASKEILVMAGDLVTREAKKHGVKILPVDSEHCAIFQCLHASPENPPNRVILTCSGGPFHAHPEIDLSTVTLEQTLKHPTWSMGRKITIDCATLMNKGLEVIEAKWLFDVSQKQIDVVIHPQSIVHSMVEFKDGSVLAQLGCPDMCLPIQFCLNYPKRVAGDAPRMDFSKIISLQFLPPDVKRFPALRLARQVLDIGKGAGAVFNAANEIAVEAFVNHRITLKRIPEIVEDCLARLGEKPCASLDEILMLDKLARDTAREMLPK